MTHERLLDLVSAGVAVVIFATLSTHQIELPGLYYDEAADAVPAMQLLLGQKVELVNNTGLVIGNLTLPVMVMDYVGAVSTYLLLPFFAVFGINVVSLRMMTLMAAAVTIVLGYLLARDLFNRPVAVATSLLIAVNPSFIFWSRQGIHVSSVMTTIAMGSMLCFLRWHRTGRAAYFCGGAFLLGLGLSAKFLFLWVIIALALSYLLFAPRRALGLLRLTRRRRRVQPHLPLARGKLTVLSRPGQRAGLVDHSTRRGGVRTARGRYREQYPPRQAIGAWVPPIAGGALARESNISHMALWGRRNGTATRFPAAQKSQTREPARAVVVAHLAWYEAFVALACFTLGAGMILIYNIKTQGTLKVLFGNLQSTERGVNNLAFIDNLGTQLKAFSSVLSGDHFWFLGGWFANPFYVPIFVGSLLVLGLVLLLHRPARRYWRPAGFVVVFVTLVLIQSCFTVSILGPTHLFVLLPLPQMLIAVAVYLGWQALSWRRPAVLLGLAILATLAAVDVGVDIQYHIALTNSGGWLSHSDAIYRLASYLDRRGVAEPIAMDWGIKTSVQILTQGRVNPIEIFQYDPQPNETFQNWLYGALTQRPDTIYLFHTEDATFYHRFQAFEDMAQKRGKKVALEWTIPQRDGRVIFNIYAVH